MSGFICDECGRCGEKICGEVHVTVTYSTWKPEPSNPSDQRAGASPAPSESRC